MNGYYKDGMFGLITGDAVGMPVQFESRSERVKEPVTDMLGYRCFNMPKGAWTDDSSLAIATLVSIKEKGHLDITDVAEKFVKWLVDGEYTPFGKAYDIGFGCKSSIERYIESKDAFTCGGRGEHDNGNGSLMRILPSCICAYEELADGKTDLDKAVKLVEDSSAITHAHDRSKIACGIYFFLVKEIIEFRKNKEWADAGNECPPFAGSLDALIECGLQNARNYYRNDISRLTELSRFGRLFEFSKFRRLPEESINSSGYVLTSIEAAIWSLVNTDNYKDCILKAVNLGDDTDTIAAIAGGLAGLYYGYDAIPDEWVSALLRREWLEETIA